MPFRRHRGCLELLARRLEELRERELECVGLAGLLSDSPGDSAPCVMLAADPLLKGLRSEIVPLLRRRGIPLCLMLDPAASANVVLDLERSLARAEQPFRFEIGLRGIRAFEDGTVPAERVYAQLLSLRRERERILQRPCSAYFARGKNIEASSEDLLQRCGFRSLIGRNRRPAGGLVASESLSSFRPDDWAR